MTSERFMDKLRSFFGYGYQVEPPKNDFRNPIWGSDDDDDGDELYARQNTMDMDTHLALHKELTRHMQDIFSSFGGMFGEMKTFFRDDVRSFFSDDPAFDYKGTLDSAMENDSFNSNKIREYYLKPGYHKEYEKPKDIDLDDKFSSQEISGLFKNHQDSGTNTVLPFDGSLVPGRNFCKTIITTSVTKADGTIETRRIVKSGNEIIEETTTSSNSDIKGPHNPGLSTISSTGIILSELSSIFKNFY